MIRTGGSASWHTRVVAAMLLLLSSLAFAQAGRVVDGGTHTFTELADGIWFSVSNPNLYGMSNSLVLVGDQDVIVVDSHVTPMAARELRKSIEVLSDKPVRYLVNTHFHFDHAHGNQAFAQDVDIIGHTYTRTKLSGQLGSVLEESTFQFFSGGVPDTIANMRRQVDAETDPARKARMEIALNAQIDYQNAIPEIVPTPPNITFENSMVLFQRRTPENREIQLRHFGPGHTGGDVVIYLPAEHMAFTGDMMLESLPYMGDAFANQWPDALAGLKSLDINLIIPGHGMPFSNMAKIGQLQSYLRDLWAKTLTMYNQGLTAEQVAERIDLTSHSADYPQITGPGADVKAIRRIYQVLNGG